MNNDINKTVVEKNYGLEYITEDQKTVSNFDAEYGDILEHFSGISFSKHAFDNLSDEALKVYKKRILYLIKHIISDSDVMAADKKTVVRKIITDDNRIFYKSRISGHERVFYTVNGDDDNKTILFFDSWSDHDSQDRIIKKYRKDGLPEGDIYYDMASFLNEYRTFMYDNRSFAEAFTREDHFIHNEIQEQAVNPKNNIRNLYIIGNAGSGKSLVGSNWLRRYAYDSNAKCLYLTMSRALVRSRKAALAEEGIDVEHGNIEFITIFDFFKEYLENTIKKYSMNDPDESFEIFKEFLADYLDKESASEEFTNYLWIYIHGLIKGYIVKADARIQKLEDKGNDFQCLQEEEFKYVVEKVFKNNCEYEIRDFYNKDNKKGYVRNKNYYLNYGKYLSKHGLKDDNDLARDILKHGYKDLGYTHVFIDECQDLTDIQLIALLYLFRNCEKRMLACDICQILQPTFFDPSHTLKYAELISGDDYHGQGKKLHFNFNYRSTKSIAEFCSKIIHEINKEVKLSVEYLNENIVTIKQGHKPLWVKAEQASSCFNILSKAESGSFQVVAPKSEVSSIKQKILKDRYVNTPVECKGMEYDTVVAVNIFNDKKSNISNSNLWMWRCLYVAATRACEYLVIVEDDNNSPVAEFLNSMVKQGYVEEYLSTSAEVLRRHLGEFGADKRLVLANKYREKGNYEEALENYLILQEQGVGNYQDEIEDCEIYALMNKKQFQDSFDKIYYCSKKQKRNTYIKELLKYRNLPKEVFIAAELFLSLAHNEENMIDSFYNQYLSYYPDEKINSNEISLLTCKVCARYSELNAGAETFITNIISEITDEIASLNRVLNSLKKEL